jgi:hypothetical protein
MTAEGPARQEPAARDGGGAEALLGDTIQHPGKLLRITSMVRGLLDEVRQSGLDQPGRARMRETFARTRAELDDVLSEDLQRELGALIAPLEATPSESEIRVVQAQLVGWLEGLLHGIQAALFAQQIEARSQLEQMRRAALPGAPGGPPPEGSRPAGHYL